MAGIRLPFVCPCAVLHPRRGDMRPACWKQSHGRVISRWSIKLGSFELCPSEFPHRREEAWPGCPKASESVCLAWPPGAYKTDWHLETPRGFSKMCQTSVLTQEICRCEDNLREIGFLHPISYSGLAAEALACRIPNQGSQPLFSDLYP